MTAGLKPCPDEYPARLYGEAGFRLTGAPVAHAQSNGAQVVDEDALTRHLYASDLPDPDLLIRTSGEMRVSNFFLWQLAYTEIWVTDTLWPDFAPKHLLQAILDFQQRERRYGGLSPEAAQRRRRPPASRSRDLVRN